MYMFFQSVYSQGISSLICTIKSICENIQIQTDIEKMLVFSHFSRLAFFNVLCY